MADVQVVLNQTLYGQQVRNVLWFFYSGTFDADGRQDIADFVRSNWVASDLHTQQVEDWQLDNVSIRDAYTTGPYATVPFTSGVLVGAKTTFETVTQVCMLATLINAGLVPPTRGRIYLAGVNSGGMTDEGFWPNVYLDLAEDLVNGFREGLTGLSETLDLRICRRAADGTAAVLNVVDNVILRANPAIQQRRRIGRGG